MPNRRLKPSELEHANAVLEFVRTRMRELAGADEDLYWALRRKVCKELGYDERGKPGLRKKLKVKKWMQQRGKCAACACDLPESGAVLDRFEAMKGYTDENTRLMCQACDVKAQAERGYS